MSSRLQSRVLVLGRGPGLAAKLFAMSQIMLIDLKIRYSMRTVNIRTLGDGCENSLLVSNSAHTSFCTVELLNLGTVFWPEADFSESQIFWILIRQSVEIHSTFVVLVNTREKTPTKSGFIRASLCGAVGWQACDTFPRSLHKVGLSGCNRIFSSDFYLAHRSRSVCSIITVGPKVKRKTQATITYQHSKDRERKLNSFFHSQEWPKHLFESGGEFQDQLQARTSECLDKCGNWL